MQRTIRFIGWLILALTLLLAVDYFAVRAKEQRESTAVSRLGGQMAAIPNWPLGAEYRVTFDRSLTPAEIDSLQELNDLRGWVGVRFVDCDLPADLRQTLAEKLAACHLIYDNGRNNAAPPP